MFRRRCLLKNSANNHARLETRVSAIDSTPQSGSRKHTGQDMRVVGVLLGVMVGLFLWRVLATFLGSNPMGRASGSDLLVIFSPIVGVVLPVALNLLDAKRSLLGIWLFALAPVAGILNVGVYVLIASVTGISSDTWNLPVISAILIWVVPAVMLFKKLGAEATARAQVGG
jgi:tetrahydromethanopterin S-methyltransferase subunit G